jgi:hypothetical protein
MEIHIQLAKILDDLNVPRYGRIRRICDRTNLERHTVANLLNNTKKQIPIWVLEVICNYLIRVHQMDPACLPGALFRLEDADFWSMLNKREYIEISFGMRWRSSGSEERWVMASDSYLHGELLHELSGIRRSQQAHAPQSLEQRLVLAPDLVEKSSSKAKFQKPQQEALNTFSTFDNIRGGKAHVCLGSIKSNLVVETVMASIFNIKPFVSQDGIAKMADRACPIYFMYRESNPKPASCHAGVQIAKEKKTAKPGIYYETENEVWMHCPSDEKRDAALVVYAFRPNEGRLDMIMGGFSGRATESLAVQLGTLGHKFWPPSYTRGNLRVGLFIVKFDYDVAARKGKKKKNGSPTVTLPKVKVISINNKVLQRRFDRASTSQKKQETAG